MINVLMKSLDVNPRSLPGRILGSLSRIDTQRLYSFALFLYVLSSLVHLSYLEDLVAGHLIFQVAKYVSLALVLLKIALLTTYERRALAVLICSYLASVISYFFSGDGTIVFLVTYVLAAVGTDASRALRSVALGVVVFSAILLGSLLIGLIPNDVVRQVNQITGDLVSRHRLGMKNQNYWGHLFVLVLLVWIFFRAHKASLVDYILLLCSAAFLYKYISSKTIAMIIVFCMVATLIYRVSLSRWLYLALLVMSIASLLAVPVCLFGLEYGIGVFVRIDDLLMGRFSFALDFLKSYGIPLLGQRIAFVSTIESWSSGAKPLVLDLSYVHLLVQYGIIATAMVGYLYYRVFRLTLEIKSFPLALMFFSMIVVGVCETWIYSLAGCVFLCIGFCEGIPSSRLLNESSFSRNAGGVRMGCGLRIRSVCARFTPQGRGRHFKA